MTESGSTLASLRAELSKARQLWPVLHELNPAELFTDAAVSALNIP
jgi:hypothetical protein